MSAQGLKSSGMEQLQPLAAFRLQPKVVADPLLSIGEIRSGFLEDRYVFRLIETRREQPPKSLDDVREQVAEDARLVDAYNQLLKRKDEFKSRAFGEMVSLAEDFETEVLSPEPFGRYQLLQLSQFGMSDRLVTPQIDPAIAADEDFVDAVWSQGFEVFLKHGTIVSGTADERTMVIEQPETQTLWAVRLSQFTPAPEGLVNAYQQRFAQPIQANFATPDQRLNPFSIKALTERTGFEWDDDARPDELGPPEAEDELAQE
jgi:hypothetical protein